jgi:hypothetical protein
MTTTRASMSSAAVAVLLLFGGARASSAACPEAAVEKVDDDCVPTRPPGVALVPDLSVLKSPDTPAFAALDLAPSAVTRPGTPTGAAVALASGIAHGLMSPGQNVALDFAPYWLLSHPTVTAKQLDDEWLRGVYRRFSFSFASTEGKVKLRDTTGTLVDTNAGRVAFGARTTLFPGYASAAALACGRRVDEFIKHDAETVAEAKRVFVKDWERDNPRPAEPAHRDGPSLKEPKYQPLNDTPEAKAAIGAMYAADLAEWQAELDGSKQNKDYLIALDAWMARRQAAIEAWRKTLDETPSADVLACMDVMHHREGPMLDVAFAEVLNFPNDDVSTLSASGSRSMIVWATGAYTKSWGPNRPGGGHAWDLSLLGLAKIAWDHVAGVPETRRGQLGARAVLAVERWGFSAEGLRTGADGIGAPPTTYRVAAAIDYHLKSGMWVTLTGGADLDDKGKPTEPLALANFHANFGKERLIAPDTTVSRPTGSSP